MFENQIVDQYLIKNGDNFFSEHLSKLQQTQTPNLNWKRKNYTKQEKEQSKSKIELFFYDGQD